MTILNVSAALLLSASVLSPFKNVVHLDKATPSDQRVEFTLNNIGHCFADLKIDGKTYTVLADHTLLIKAPAGTVIYAANRFDDFRRGDAVLTVNASLKESRLDLR